MQTHFSKIEVQLEKLLTATGCLEQSRAADVAQHQASTVRDLIRKLPTQLDEYLAATPASTPGGSVTNDQPVVPNSGQANAGESMIPSSTKRLVLHDMDVWEVVDQMVSGHVLNDGYCNRAGVILETETFPLTIKGLRMTIQCKNQYEDMLKKGPNLHLNVSDIKARASSLWATIMVHINTKPEACMEAVNAFDRFIELVEAKIRATEETTVDGVAVFA